MNFHSVPSSFFRPIHRLIGALNEFVMSDAVRGFSGSRSKGRGDLQNMSMLRSGALRLEERSATFGNFCSLDDVGSWQDEEEFFSAPASDRVTRPDGPLQALAGDF